MTTFKAFRIHETGGKISARFEDLTLDALTPGEVVIDVQFSDINYKDALAATGAGRILRRYPLVGGIDLAGIVKSSDDARFSAGDAVLVTGCGLSETFDGGYAEVARVKAESVIADARGPRRISRDGARHRGLHRGAGHSSHGAQWPGARRADPSSSPAPPAASAVSPSTCSPARGYEVDRGFRQAGIVRISQVARR